MENDLPLSESTLLQIETAPKDGTQVYIFGGKYVCDDQSHGMSHDGPSLAVFREARNPDVDPPWVLLDIKTYARVKNPSHWAPAPSHSH